MTYAVDDFDTLPRMPSWITSGAAQGIEDAAFFSGAALSHLHLILTRDEVPQALLRERLALRAAEVCLGFSGRPEQASDLRDAVEFLGASDTPGPAGEGYLSWRKMVRRPATLKNLYQVLAHTEIAYIASCLDQGERDPVSRAAATLETALSHRPRDLDEAFVLAETAFAQAIRWPQITPLLALGLRRSDLKKTGDDLRFACHRAVCDAVGEAVREALDLARRAARLRAVAPKLRAKGADHAVGMFLSRDALAPTALTSLRSNRAARRFCDRLVSLGAARELTGRDTFRLYGL